MKITTKVTESDVEQDDDDDDHQNNDVEGMKSVEHHGVAAKPYQIIMLCCSYTGTELAYGVQSAYVTPILASLGIPLRYLTLAWAISPILGLMTQPILGSYSDSCTSRWGRRRPFIAVVLIGILIGLLATGFGRDLGSLLSPNTMSIAIVFTLIGNGLLDYSLDASGVPCRAYLFDVTPHNQEHKYQRFAAIFASIGAIIGYLICGLDWNFSFGSVVISQNHSVFILTTFLVCILYIISLFSVKEVPFVRPTKTTSQNAIKQVQLPENNDVSTTQVQDDSMMVDQHQTNAATKVNDNHSHLTAVFHAILKMPREFLILFILDTIAWIGYVCFSVFFTDFVGIEVFEGNATAPVDSAEYLLYQRGVQIGSWGLLGQAALGGTFALCLERISRRVGKRIWSVLFTS